MSQDLTHFSDQGDSRMVDVGSKPITHRLARASGRVKMAPETLRCIRDRQLAKGDVLAVAQLAGIMAAKRTGELIPLCHPLLLNQIAVTCIPNVAGECVDIEATVSVSGKTGVEMEALMAVTVAGLTIYDMAKAVDRGMRLTDVRLVRKAGGRSGDWEEAQGSREKGSRGALLLSSAPPLPSSPAQLNRRNSSP